MATPQQTREKLRAVAHRAPDLCHVLRKQLLVPLELVPGDVAIVVVTKQDRPVLRVLLGNPAPHALAAIVDHRLLAAPAIGIGAGVDRVGENLGDPPRRCRNPPDQALTGGTDREFYRVAMKPEKHLPDAAKLSELAEHQMDRITLALVRCHLDAIAIDLLVARRQRGKQLAALRHRQAAFQ